MTELIGRDESTIRKALHNEPTLNDQHIKSGIVIFYAGRAREENSKQSFELLKETEYDPKTDLGNSRIYLHQPLRPADLAKGFSKGFWKTTIHGTEVDEPFVKGPGWVSPACR